MTEKIASFTVDHTKLLPGLYVSRNDGWGNASVATFDLRMKKPNNGDYLSTSAAHALEHLGATFLRNHAKYAQRTVYFGPMGCRTGFYALFFGDVSVDEIAPVFKEMCEYILSYEGTLPGESAAECGNYKDLSLEEAKKEAYEYLQVLKNLDEHTTNYPF